MKWLPLLPVFLCSCFLSGPHFRRASFSYQDNNQAQSLPLLLPKGMTSQKTTTDSAGNTTSVYRYGKSVFYVAYVTDTMQTFQAIDTSMNIPRIHPLGGLIYKGIDDKGLFWREIKREHLRFGYMDVGKGNEFVFDSATNYASGIRPVK